jgi:hypothetical protein
VVIFRYFLAKDRYNANYRSGKKNQKKFPAKMVESRKRMVPAKRAPLNELPNAMVRSVGSDNLQYFGQFQAPVTLVTEVTIS